MCERIKNFFRRKNKEAEPPAKQISIGNEKTPEPVKGRPGMYYMNPTHPANQLSDTDLMEMKEILKRGDYDPFSRILIEQALDKVFGPDPESKK